MQKFSKLFLIFLVILIIGGLLARFLITASEEDVQQVEDEAASSIPGYSTMLHIHQVAKEQQLEEGIINIEIAQENDLHSATIHLQSNVYMDEEVILKDSYNMLAKLVQLEQLASVTMLWYKPVHNKNEKVITFTLDQQALNHLNDYAYSDIPTIATTYVVE